MGEWVWFGLVAGGVAVACCAVLLSLARRPSVRRLDPGGVAAGDADPPPVLGDMTDVLAGGLPGAARDELEIAPILLRAGYYSRTALVQYRAIRALLTLAPVFVAAGVAMLVSPGWIPYAAGGGLVLALVGYSVPRVYLALAAHARDGEIERGLPVFADMLAIALLAGQGLIRSLERVTEQLRGPFPRMTEELGLVLRQAEMLNLAVAFERWADRSQSVSVRNLAVILTQSQLLGNDVSAALTGYAASVRVNARQRADARAQRATFWMLFPTMLFLWIPAAVVLVAPVYFELNARRAKAREALPKADPNNLIGKTLNPKNRTK
ncbi:type II secretion system F family protein [Fimbriiglobus ruber]|uniref:Type II/IV secretion system protein TadC, associated with Flp pilus assembly n=1 Tax=Fimbriiglobus ruber TaxID=1908690 RepID=A0A225D0X9_9BACT|nr:type II secretion system F family protein [Fimbriiglobus ruber]OWK35260.1 Type II/IV secretion system protein TadC, associated with Flp pilus assembly [Fimbriiglobus ruber]